MESPNYTFDIHEKPSILIWFQFLYLKVSRLKSLIESAVCIFNLVPELTRKNKPTWLRWRPNVAFKEGLQLREIKCLKRIDWVYQFPAKWIEFSSTIFANFFSEDRIKYLFLHLYRIKHKSCWHVILNRFYKRHFCSLKLHPLQTSS